VILIRTDCGGPHGWGHLMRCLAIADEIRASGGAATFQVGGDTEQAGILLAGRHPMTAVGHFIDVRAIAEAAMRAGARTLLLDGYGFSDDDERVLSESGMSVAVLDDFGHNPHRFARLIVNGNLHYAHRSLYAEAPQAQLLLGPSFAPLRPALARQRIAPRSAPEAVQNLLVVMGGSDVAGMRDTVLGELTRSIPPAISLTVAAPPVPPHGRPWSAHARRLRWVSEPDAVAAEMARSDLAVSAGGMTSYELAFMGVPAVLVPATEVQAPVSTELMQRGAALVVAAGEASGRFIAETVGRLLNARVQRQQMTNAGQSIFDGAGARRIAKALLMLQPKLQ
jgi:UDP-2,4-diacetamido-2,4,6-trideoxy-beta-L-altropyranose hydrolase